MYNPKTNIALEVAIDVLVDFIIEGRKCERFEERGPTIETTGIDVTIKGLFIHTPVRYWQLPHINHCPCAFCDECLEPNRMELHFARSESVVVGHYHRISLLSSIWPFPDHPGLNFECDFKIQGSTHSDQPFFDRLQQTGLHLDLTECNPLRQIFLHFVFATLFSGKTYHFNADFHRLSGGNDDRHAPFSIPQKRSLFLEGTIPDGPIHMSWFEQEASDHMSCLWT
jgi:hypothetical protein